MSSLPASPALNARFSQERLEALRRASDPIADRTISALLDRHGHERARVVMRTFLREERNDATPADPIIADYVRQAAVIPEWADRTLLSEGSDLFGRHGPPIILALLCGSLPTSYAAAKGAKVLHHTGRLQSDALRRLFETTQFVVDVTSPGAFEPGGAGLRSALKVRLIHAAARWSAANDPGWLDEWGTPINQEDTAGTMLAFSTLVLRCLDRMDIHPTPREQEAYLHLWKVTASLLGLVDELMPANAQEAEALAFTIGRRHVAPSPEGRELTRALIAATEEWTPGTIFKGFVPALMRHLLEPEVIAAIDVPEADWTDWLIDPLRWMNWAADGVGDFSELTATAFTATGHWLVAQLVRASTDGQRQPFRMPALAGGAMTAPSLPRIEPLAASEPDEFYKFRSVWRIRAERNLVFSILEDAGALARWWPSVYMESNVLSRGDARGIGRTVSVHSRGLLPYTLRWGFRVTSVQRPALISIEASGDFVGRGTWRLRPDGDHTEVVFDWRIRVNKPLLQRLSKVVRPALEFNHRWAMSRGAESLAIEVRRRAAKTPADLSLVSEPPRSPARFVPWVVLASMAGALIWLLA